MEKLVATGKREDSHASIMMMLAFFFLRSELTPKQTEVITKHFTKLVHITFIM
jgi:hypothetical protein